MALGGAFAAAIVIPSLPELQLGIGETDEPAKAALCSIWNGTHSPCLRCIVTAQATGRVTSGYV